MHFSPLRCLHRNHLRWVNFGGQTNREKRQPLFVCPGCCMFLAWLSTMHPCVFSNVRFYAKVRQHSWMYWHTLSPPFTILHTGSHTHTRSFVLHSALMGSILMTVNSPDNCALSIFRQNCSVVKWTNTQRMRLLAGLMMPDWLAAVDASADENVIYPPSHFLALSVSVSHSSRSLLSHTSLHLEAALVQFHSNQ